MPATMKRPSKLSPVQQPEVTTTQPEQTTETGITPSSNSFDELWDNEPEASGTNDAGDETISPVDETTASESESLEPANETATVDAATDASDPGEPEPPPDDEESEQWSDDARVELGDIELDAPPPPPSPAPARPANAQLSPEEHYNERHEAATEHYVTCSIARARLEAALKVAKKREKDALEDLSEIIDRGIEPTPLFDRMTSPSTHGPILPATAATGQEATDVAADGGNNASVEPGATTDDETAVVDPDAWKAVSISVLNLKPALTERLVESGMETLGKLEAFRAEAADRRASWPKGIGEAKITQIEDAVVDWLTKNRDSHLFGQGSGEAGSVAAGDATSAAVYPTEAEWAEMTEDAQTSWLNARTVQLDGDNVDELVNRVAEGCDDFFTDGIEAFQSGDLIVNCEHSPGLECDAWILGWLWQGKQEEETEGDK